MPALTAKARPLGVANARRSTGYGCALRLDWAGFGGPLDHADCLSRSEPVPYRGWARWGAVFCGLLLALAGTAAADTPGAAPRAIGEVPALDAGEAVRLAEDAVGRTVPDFELRDRNGKPVRLGGYRGKPLLVSFIYTGCFQICPTQTRTLYEAVQGLDKMLGEGQFNIVSIGFNQPFDDPSAMRAFAAQHRIQHRNWEFLSPRPGDVEALTRAFGFSWVATPAGFDHVLGVSVVDTQGRIHSQVLGDVVRADRLGVPLRRLLLYEDGAPVSNTLGTLLERVRILCTVYDAETGEYRYDYKLIFQTIGGLLFFLTMFIYLFREWRRQRRHRRDQMACPPPTHVASGSGA